LESRAEVRELDFVNSVTHSDFVYEQLDLGNLSWSPGSLSQWSLFNRARLSSSGKSSRRPCRTRRDLAGAGSDPGSESDSDSGGQHSCSEIFRAEDLIRCHPHHPAAALHLIVGNTEEVLDHLRQQRCVARAGRIVLQSDSGHLSCWFQRPRTMPGRGITHGLLTTQTCGTSRQQRIQTGWRLAKTFWIKIVSSRGHSLQDGTISSSATTRSGRFRQLFGDWGSIPVRPTEFSDLTRNERSRVARFGPPFESHE